MASNIKKKSKNHRKNKKNKLQKPNKASQSASEDLPLDNEGLEESQHGENDDNELESDAKKRHYNENDSDAEDKPPKKKKKKPQSLPDASDKKNKKSIRQMKREKFAERQAAAEVVAKDQLKSQCLNYLSQWKHNRQNWKFMKAKQVWIFKNKFSLNLIPDASWPLLLEYFESAKGNIRNMLLEDANKVIKQMDEWTESQNKEKNEDEVEEKEVKKPDEVVYKRARDLIQCLEE